MVKKANFFIDPNKIHEEAPRVIQVPLDEMYKMCAKASIDQNGDAIGILAEVLSLADYILDIELLNLYIKREQEKREQENS